MHTITYIKNNIEILIFFILVIIFILVILKRNWEGFYNAQHGINRLDAIIYINTDTDEGDDRNENSSDENSELLMKELIKLNTNMKKVHKANKNSGVYIPKKGHNGCIQSHILALKMVKKNNWKKVLILEDNVELDMSSDSFNDLLNKTLDTLDDKYSNWDVIMLAASNININNKFSSIPIDVVSPDGSLKDPLKIHKIKSAKNSSAYIIKDSYVDKILDLFNKKEEKGENNKNMNMNMNMNKNKNILNQEYNNEYLSLDNKWGELQGKDNWFIIDKVPIIQRI